eukprot:180062-Alexandrium_andersonii.AAC.1
MLHARRSVAFAARGVAHVIAMLCKRPPPETCIGLFCESVEQCVLRAFSVWWRSGHLCVVHGRAHY